MLTNPWLDAGNTTSQAANTGNTLLPCSFTLANTGKLNSYFELVLNDPKTNGTPALFVGGFFIPRDFQHGCDSQSHGLVGLASRADITLRERGEGKPPIRTLVEADHGTHPLLHIQLALPRGRTAKERFFAGVVHSCKIVARDHSSDDMVLRFTRDGDKAIVYYADGMVKQVIRKGDTLDLDDLTVDDQGKIRLTHALKILSDAEDIDDERKCSRSQNYALHQLIAVIGVGGKRSKALFDNAFDLLCEHVKKGLVRPGVKHHALEVLRQNWSVEAMMFQAMFKEDASNGEVLSPYSNEGRKGPPAEAKARKALKSERDREIRNKMRGTLGEQPLKPNGKKGKKKKA